MQHVPTKILTIVTHALAVTQTTELLAPILIIVTLHTVNQASAPTKTLTTVTHVNLATLVHLVHTLTIAIFHIVLQAVVPTKTQALVPTANQTTQAHPVLGQVNIVTYHTVLLVPTKTHHHAQPVSVATPTMAPHVLGTSTVMFLFAHPVPTKTQVVVPLALQTIQETVLLVYQLVQLQTVKPAQAVVQAVVLHVSAVFLVSVQTV